VAAAWPATSKRPAVTAAIVFFIGSLPLTVEVTATGGFCSRIERNRRAAPGEQGAKAPGGKRRGSDSG
jgi:hypothetical protein